MLPSTTRTVDGRDMPTVPKQGRSSRIALYQRMHERERNAWQRNSVLKFTPTGVCTGFQRNPLVEANTSINVDEGAWCAQRQRQGQAQGDKGFLVERDKRTSKLVLEVAARHGSLPIPRLQTTAWHRGNLKRYCSPWTTKPASPIQLSLHALAGEKFGVDSVFSLHFERYYPVRTWISFLDT
jgi:hypothetical protein